MDENKKIKSMKSSGILYIVATPIGNLEDITLRALRILKEVDFILCEDTRVTQKLLNKYEIKTKLLTLHKFNEKSQITKIISLLRDDKNIALVSDAGTPTISDPGSELVSAILSTGLKVIPLPGASALISALSICPIPFNNFYFTGFLPEKASEKEKTISSFNNISALIILYVAPHDLKKHLKEIYSHYPDLEIFYARELTKIYEECWHGRIDKLMRLLEAKNIKGEVILILDFQKSQNKTSYITEKEIIGEMKKEIEQGKSLKETSKHFAKQYNLSSKSLYKMYIKK